MRKRASSKGGSSFDDPEITDNAPEAMAGSGEDGKAERRRLDKWLWFARFAKTRSLAARLVADGHVRVNGKRVENAAKGVSIGDVLTVAAAHGTLLVRVRALGERRGPAPEARTLYADLDAGAAPEPPDREPGA